MRVSKKVFVAPALGALLLAACSEAPQTAAPTGPPMIIEPNLAVGKIRAGMTVTQVVAELGEPKRRTATSLQYPQLGLAVMPDEQGIAQVVMCGDVMGLGAPYGKAFNGRTSDGIGLGATREQVVAAFGEPTEKEGSRVGLRH